MKSSQDRTPKFYDPQFFSDNEIDGFTHPLCGLGAGDSSLYLNVFSDFTDVQSFEILREEVDWKSMFHKGGEVPRLVAIQGTVSNESYPIYRHPAEKCPDIVPWTKTVCDIKNQLENLTGTIYNHCLIQYYRTSVDYISEHSDKTLDISRDTHVVNYSLGASRVMILKSKKLSDNNNDKEENSKICQKITLPHNSVFFLGWQTNRLFTHEIKQDKRLSNLKRSDELICNGGRISLTFRSIATYVDRFSGRLYGQGSVYKTKEELYATLTASTKDTKNDIEVRHNVTNNGIFNFPDNNIDENNAVDDNNNNQNDNEQNNDNNVTLVCANPNTNTVDENATVDSNRILSQLLIAFSNENRSPCFDWDQEYGKGFDILSFTS